MRYILLPLIPCFGAMVSFVVATEFTAFWWTLPFGIGFFVYYKYGKDRSFEYDDKIPISPKRKEEVFEKIMARNE